MCLPQGDGLCGEAMRGLTINRPSPQHSPNCANPNPTHSNKNKKTTKKSCGVGVVNVVKRVCDGGLVISNG